MVKRSIPLGRRLRAARGQIFLGTLWISAVALSGVLLLVDPQDTRTAVAVTRVNMIRAPESGRLASLNVVPLQHVDAGAVIGTVEVPGLSQQIAAADADLRALEAQLSSHEADRDRKFSKDLETSRAAWLGARVALERDRARLTGLDQELARSTAPGVELASAEIDRQKVARDTAAAALDARTAQVAALDTAFKAAEMRAGGLKDLALTSAVEAATVKLEVLRIEADSNTLRAQVAGVVVAPGSTADGAAAVADSFPSAGQWVQAGVPIVQIVDATTQDAVVFVDVAHARDLTPGAAVSVHGQGGGSYQAKIRMVGVAVEPVPTRQLRDRAVPEWGIPVTVQVPDSVLVPGEAVTVEF